MRDEIQPTESCSRFALLRLPDGQTAWIPDDIELRWPASSSLDPVNLHYLIFIPWRERYLEQIEPVYRDFFQVVLPYLHTRTTDVHVATCLPFIRELAQADTGPVDVQVVTIAFILHDSGWSGMSEQEIAESLGIQGLHLYGNSLEPKQRHAELGKMVAEKVLGEYAFQPPLSAGQKEQIYQAILFHDRPQELAVNGEIPANVEVVCNTDHLWSFTHLNFWQDTVRKGVRPDIYLRNLQTDLEAYFVSKPGRRKARQLLEARCREVETWGKWLEDQFK